MQFRFVPALLFVLLSGAAALAHQVLWVRLMVDALGANAGTFARVTGTFFLGLATGAWIASRFLPAKPARWIAAAEIAIALSAASTLYLASKISGWLTFGFWGYALDWLIPLPAIGLPALFMGLVLPWLLAHTKARDEHAVWLYSANTFGGIAGILLTLGLALPALGLAGSVGVAVALNLCVAFLALFLPSLHRSAEDHKEDTPTATLSPWMASLAFASGFLLLGMEVVFQHQLAQVTVNSLFSGGAVLCVVLFFLACASLLAPWVARLSGSAKSGLATALPWIALLVAAQPFLFVFLRGGLHLISYEKGKLAYFEEMVRVASLGMGPSLLAVGLLFPLLLLAVRGEPRLTGRLLAWNGLGGLLGAELTQFVIGPMMGLWQSVSLFALAYLGLWVFLEKPRRLWLAVLFLLLTLAVLLTPGLPVTKTEKDERVVEAKLGSEGLVAAVRKEDDDWSILFNNAYTLGGSKAQYHQERQAHLPLLLHPNPQRIGLIGVATGSTLAGAAMHSGISEIEAFELSPLALDFAQRHFARFNRRVFEDPRVSTHIADGRRAILATPESYDVLIADLFLPWRTGEGRLYTIEHFEKARQSLRPGGIFAQWLPLYQLTREQFDLIARTFLQVFPDAVMIRGDFYSRTPIVALIGTKDAPLRGFHPDSALPPTEDPSVSNREALDLFWIGPFAGQIPPGPINTLLNARLEFMAADNIIGEKSPWFVGEDWIEFNRKWKDNAGLKLVEIDESMHLEKRSPADWRKEAQLWIPENVWMDTGAKWEAWPSRVRP